MTYRISLKEQRAQLVAKTMNNGTKIVSQPCSEGWVMVEVEINHGIDALNLYHAGMEARGQQDKEWKERYKSAGVVV